MANKKKIYVAILNQGTVRSEFLHLMTEIVSDNRHEYMLATPQYKPFVKNLNYTCRAAVESGADYLFVMDDDNPPLRFPVDLFDMNLDAIACPTPMYQNGEIGFNVFVMADDGYRELPKEKRKGLVEADVVGTGCFIVKTSVLKEIGYPYLEWNYDSDSGEATLGPEFRFCEKIKEAGNKIYAHYDYPCSHYKDMNLLDVLSWGAKMIEKNG